MNLALINWLAVFVAALSGFVIGSLWYNPSAFGYAWMKDSNLSEEQIKSQTWAKRLDLQPYSR
ncbi:MAG: DUF1761 domain-containing protein [Mucilaginibacter sp.]